MRATIAHAASRIVEDSHRRPDALPDVEAKADETASKSVVVQNLTKVRNLLLRLAH